MNPGAGEAAQGAVSQTLCFALVGRALLYGAGGPRFQPSAPLGPKLCDCGRVTFSRSLFCQMGVILVPKMTWDNEPDTGSWRCTDPRTTPKGEDT